MEHVKDPLAGAIQQYLASCLTYFSYAPPPFRPLSFDERVVNSAVGEALRGHFYSPENISNELVSSITGVIKKEMMVLEEIKTIRKTIDMNNQNLIEGISEVLKLICMDPSELVKEVDKDLSAYSTLAKELLKGVSNGN